MPAHFHSMPEHEVRRHRQRKTRGGDFLLASQDVCAPSQTSGVKKTLSSVFFTLTCSGMSGMRGSRQAEETNELVNRVMAIS